MNFAIASIKATAKVAFLFSLLCLLSFRGYAQGMRYVKLNEIVVKQKINNPKEIIKIIASDFIKRYSPQNEISKATEYRAAKANGSFIEFKAGKGFYLSRRYQYKDRYVKAPMLCFIDRYSSLEKEFIDENPPLGYNNLMGFLPADVIGYIIQFSPLNKEYYKYYEYSFTEETGKIHFKSVGDKNQNKCKIRAEGYICYNIEKFSIESILFSKIDPCLYGGTGDYSHSSYAVAEFNNGASLSIRSLFYNRKWDKATQNSSVRNAFSLPTRRNPQKYNHEEYYLLRIDRAKYLMDSNMIIKDYQTMEIRKDLDSLFNKLSFYCLRYECAPYTPDLWRNQGDFNIREFPLKQAVEDIGRKVKIDDQVMRYVGYEPTLEDFNKLRALYEGGYDKYIPDYQTFISYYKLTQKRMRDAFEE